MQLGKCKLLLLLLLIFLFSCQEVNKENSSERQDLLFKKHYREITAEISKMIEDDQALRFYYIYGTVEHRTIDSIRRMLMKKGIDPDSLEAINGSLLPQQIQDSICSLLKTQDTKHTKRTIEIIKQYGFPSGERIGDSDITNPTLLLEHADTLYGNEILALLNRELSLGRVDSNCVEIINWHVHGRIGIPNLKDVTIIHIDKETHKADTIRN